MNKRKILTISGMVCLGLAIISAFFLQEELLFAFGISGLWCAIMERNVNEEEEEVKNGN